MHLKKKKHCAYFNTPLIKCQFLTHCRVYLYTLIPPFTHSRQFTDANQPTNHVFGLDEETELSGGNLRTSPWGEHAF